MLEGSALTACTTGKENLPSVKSSQKPLVVAYCSTARECSHSPPPQAHRDAHLGALQIEVVVSNLKHDAKQIRQSN